MKPYHVPHRWVWLLLLSWPFQQVVGQSSLPLSIQPHKIKQARQLYRDGMAKQDPALIAQAYYVYGRAYYLVGNYVTAHRWFTKSLHIEEKRGDSLKLGMVYIRLCDNEMAQHHYQESMQYVRKALGIFRRIQSNKGLLRAYSLLGNIHQIAWRSDRNKEITPSREDSALYYYRKFERLAYQFDDSLEIAWVTGHLGGLLVARRDPRGLSYQQTSLTIYRKKKVDGHQMYSMMGLAWSYLRFGKPKQAYEWLMKAQLLYADKHLNEYNMLRQLEEIWIQYCQAIGSWQQAFAHQVELRRLEKREAAADRQAAIAGLHLGYEAEKKEILLKTQKQELALRSASLLNHQRFMWAMLALLVVTVGMSLLFFRLYRHNQRISAYNAELVNEQNHRFKNNLQIVSTLLSLEADRLPDETVKQVVEESQLRMQAMATLHRQLYDGNRLTKVSLPEFVSELVGDVLETFGYAHLQPTYDIDPIWLSADQALPVGLLLNELTTNACKYAFPASTEPIFQVSCHQARKTIILRVADNGPGYSPILTAQEAPKRPFSFGMRLIQMQVEQLRGSCRFMSSGGTLFTLQFNI